MRAYTHHLPSTFQRILARQPFQTLQKVMYPQARMAPILVNSE